MGILFILLALLALPTEATVGRKVEVGTLKYVDRQSPNPRTGWAPVWVRGEIW